MLFVGVYLGVIITHAPTSTLFDANVRPDFGWEFTALGWFVFALGLVLIFSIRWRNFGWVALFIYLAYFTQLIATLAFGDLDGVFLGGTIIAFLGSLLLRTKSASSIDESPMQPEALVLKTIICTRANSSWVKGHIISASLQL